LVWVLLTAAIDGAFAPLANARYRSPQPKFMNVT
jgi:hypothetical protein